MKIIRVEIEYHCLYQHIKESDVKQSPPLLLHPAKSAVGYQDVVASTPLFIDYYLNGNLNFLLT